MNLMEYLFGDKRPPRKLTTTELVAAEEQRQVASQTFAGAVQTGVLERNADHMERQVAAERRLHQANQERLELERRKAVLEAAKYFGLTVEAVAEALQNAQTTPQPLLVADRGEMLGSLERGTTAERHGLSTTNDRR